MKSKPRKTCANCEKQRLLYQRVARDEIIAHNRRITILSSEIAKLDEDFDEALLLLTAIQERLGNDALASHNYLITPADRKQIKAWIAARFILRQKPL